MDEPKEQPGATPSAAAPATSEKPQVFTREQVEAAERKGRSDALAEVGRFKASAETALRQTKAAQERLAKMEEEHDKAEMEAAHEDPPRLLALQERQRRRQAESEVTRLAEENSQKEAQLKALQAERADGDRVRNVQDVATRFSIDPARLMKVVKHTDGSMEVLEDLAKELSPTKPPLKPDSGGAVGGGESFEQLRERYIANPRRVSREDSARLFQMIEERKRA